MAQRCERCDGTGEHAGDRDYAPGVCNACRGAGETGLGIRLATLAHVIADAARGRW